jgi:hypothetical protein
VVGAIPAILAVLQLGRIHPDELYQCLEPAFYRAFGYGVLSWEWEAGVRNWAIPIFFSWLLKLCQAIGISDPRAYRAVLEVPQYLLHAGMLTAVFRYAARRVGPTGGLWAMAAVGLSAPVIVFAGRTLGESFSTAFVVIGLEALDPNRPSPRSVPGLLGGAALGLSVVARYGSIVLAAAALIWLVFRREWRLLVYAASGFLAVTAGLGGLDWLSWGRPFHSVLAYVQFNVLSGEAAQQFGRAAWSYYLPVLGRALAPWAWIGLGFCGWKRRGRLSLPFFCAATYIVALSALAHKEERFLYPALLCMALGAAPGLVELIQHLAPRIRAVAAVGALGTNVLGFVLPGELKAQRGDLFRAIVRASRPPNSTGLMIVNEGLWGAGGFFYIGKRIAWLTCDTPRDANFQRAVRNPVFNRAVTYEQRAVAELQAAGFRVLEQEGNATVLERP